MEIVHIFEQRNVSFEKSLMASIEFHRNELSDWILIHYKCPESSLFYACIFFNYMAFIFEFMNEIDNTNALAQLAKNGHLDVVKYL